MYLKNDQPYVHVYTAHNYIYKFIGVYYIYVTIRLRLFVKSSSVITKMVFNCKVPVNLQNALSIGILLSNVRT